MSELASVRLVTPATIIHLVYRMNGSESEGKCILVGTLAPFFVETECNPTTVGLFPEGRWQLMDAEVSPPVPLGAP